MGELSKLPNIGKEVERQLTEVGIDTFEKLKRCGAEEAWLRIQRIDESACIHRLLALEGALQKLSEQEEKYCFQRPKIFISYVHE